MEVEEVQSRSGRVVHRNEQNMSAAQTTDDCCGSRLDRVFFLPSCTNHIGSITPLTVWMPGIWQQHSFATTAITPPCYHTPTVYHPGW